MSVNIMSEEGDAEESPRGGALSFTTVMYRQAQIHHPLFLNNVGPATIETVNVDCETFPDLFDELFALSQNTKHLHYTERAHLIMAAHSRYMRTRRARLPVAYVYERNKMRRSYSEGNFDEQTKSVLKSASQLNLSGAR